MNNKPPILSERKHPKSALFSMHQDIGGSVFFDYTATVTSSTQLDGVLQLSGSQGNLTRAFTATRIDAK